MQAFSLRSFRFPHPRAVPEATVGMRLWRVDRGSALEVAVKTHFGAGTVATFDGCTLPHPVPGATIRWATESAGDIAGYSQRFSAVPSSSPIDRDSRWR